MTALTLALMGFAALAVVQCSGETKTSPPVVQVYSRDPGEFGKKNMLMCHAKGFHPPDIRIQLTKNGEEIPNAAQTDLAFHKDWRFHLTKNVEFTPERGVAFTCRVTHGKSVREYSWEPNM